MRLIISLLVVFTLFFCSNMVTAHEPTNLGLLKKEVVKYHDSGEYDKDLTKTIGKAEQYLQKRIQKAGVDNKQKLAVVLDIDETSISNYKHMTELGFGGTHQDLDRTMGQGDDPAIPEALKLYHLAKANNVAVFFITGRGDNLRAITEKNLKDMGFNNWDGLYMRPADKQYPSIIPFKSSTRKMLEDKGYDIIISMGDQKSDLAGGYADATFKLPNPYYYIP
jgi:acid phosphatase